MINESVQSFQKRPLDEWILDYPQQIILTSIHLILTHEINDLFDSMIVIKDNTKNSSISDLSIE